MSGKRGKLFVIAAPSGAGKTSLVRALMQLRPALRFSISYTTRKQRPNERHSHDYFFVDRAEFERMVAAGDFLEHARVFDNYYGTSRRQVEQLLDASQGRAAGDRLAGRAADPASAAGVPQHFVLPPSREALEQRLRGRGTDSDEVIARRFARFARDLSHWSEFGPYRRQRRLRPRHRRSTGNRERSGRALAARSPEGGNSARGS
jgi:guanylate kinase